MPRSPTLPELRFVVVGAHGTGKSTFIHHALDLKKPLSLPVASKKMSLEGDVFMIRLTEIQLADVDVDEDYDISWPHQARDAAATATTATATATGDHQRIDGVLALYDVARKETLEGIPQLLSKSNQHCRSCRAGLTYTLRGCRRLRAVYFALRAGGRQV